jgi:hypothetical protein
VRICHEVPDRIHHFFGLLEVGVVTRPLHDMETGVGYSGGELGLMLRWEHEIVTPRHHQGGGLDLT